MAKGDYVGKKKHDVEHKCPICENLFYGRPNKKYCSAECKHVSSNLINVRHYHEDEEWRAKRKKNSKTFISNNPDYHKKWKKSNPNYFRNYQRNLRSKEEVNRLKDIANETV